MNGFLFCGSECGCCCWSLEATTLQGYEHGKYSVDSDRYSIFSAIDLSRQLMLHFEILTAGHGPKITKKITEPKSW